MLTKAMTIATRRPRRVQITVPSQPNRLTNRIAHPPLPEIPTLVSTPLSKPLHSLTASATFLAQIVSHHRTADNAPGLPRTLRLSLFVHSHSPTSLPAYFRT